MPEPKKIERPDGEDQDYAFLGREFMSWLLFRVARGEATFEDESGDFSMAFGGRVRLAGPAGDVTDAVLKGSSPAASVELHAGLGAGRSIREAEMRISRGEREFRFTLIAETLDLRTVKMPAPLRDENDDRLADRMALLEELESCIRAAFQAFVKERTRPVWQRSVIPEMRAWLAESLKMD
jgi:hypothetical protein